MSDESEADSYSLIARIIHWLTALIILGLLVVGTYMTTMDMSEQKLQFYNLHKSFGLLVLALAFVRIAWHLIKKKPKSLPTHKKWEKILSHAVHGFLYLLLIAIPISGWVMSSAGDFNIKFFSLNMPDIVSKDENLFKLSHGVHEILAWVLLVLLMLHIAGALKHHVIDRDETLGRMTWRRIGMIPVTVLVFLLAGVYGYIVLEAGLKKFGEQNSAVKTSIVGTSQADEEARNDENVIMSADGVPQWQIDSGKSNLTFQATQYGQTFDGSFDFNGAIYFDPALLDKSNVKIEIDIASIKTGSEDRDSQARAEDWFNVATYPKAVFEAEEFTTGHRVNSYEASGTLTLRGITMPIILPFALVISDNGQGQSIAEMTATLDLNRLDFGVGQGQWQKTGAISDKVTINISLLATQLRVQK